jgi:putative Mg2+ transporter-C (MgtC) family protein
MQDALSMLVSLILGTLVGWEREAGRKPAGLRTHTLVCMGSTAASIWMVAAIGVAVGVHAWWLAVTGAILALVVLEGYRRLERRANPPGETRQA